MGKQDCRILGFECIGLDDIALVGGKNANLGELSHMQNINNILVPPGFALTTVLYREFIENNDLDELILRELRALTNQQHDLGTTGTNIRLAITNGEFTEQQKQEIADAYQDLCEKVGVENCDVAVRSSATAEDLPEASFAGQQESYLNVQGVESLLSSCRLCFASLYTDRAIAYRDKLNVDNQGIALSVGVQQMVRSDVACAGVMFSVDTETGFPDAVLINASWGLGETVVKGSVIPDRYMVFKPLLANKLTQPIIEKRCGSKLYKMIYHPRVGDIQHAPGRNPTVGFTRTMATNTQEQQTMVLSDDEILLLAGWAVSIATTYGRPMDIEWAKDGVNGNLYIVQARPETITSRKDHNLLKTYRLKQTSLLLAQGASVGNAIVCGKVCYLKDPSEADKFPTGGILVTQRTDPDWVPVMKRAGGIVTDSGGTTSHAAIVSRELQVPAIVGTGTATQTLKNSAEVTLDCASSSVGKVYLGSLDYDVSVIRVNEIPHTNTDVMINIAVPDGALRWWQLPCAGIGLTRIEFIINGIIKVHPMALVHPERVADPAIKQQIEEIIMGHASGAEYFVDTLARGIGKVAASCYPRPAVVRFSDFKSNEYKKLIGGKDFELDEENPMLGLRGASRYYHPSYKEAFLLECSAIKNAREKMGFTNIIAMIPFCRTVEEADKVLAIMAECGLTRSEEGLQVYMMCEVPSNVVLADEFAQRFDGFSIGSNDLTQLVLGVDRDSAEIAHLFDPKNLALSRMIREVIRVAHQHGVKVGICGQAPSDYPQFAEFLVSCGIDSISLNPDSFATTINSIARAEKEMANSTGSS
jgi:pyruvate,water dikinase